MLRKLNAATACLCCACLQSLAAEAAAAAAVVASSGGGSSSSREAAALSPTRCVLVLCANLGAVRGRLLPQQFSRWAALLQAGGGGAGGKELQAAAQACAAELEAAETRLASAYIDRKQVLLSSPPATPLWPVAMPGRKRSGMYSLAL
jgi:hypothetical protein